MKAEIICTLITAAGVLLSAIISYGISRFTANKEIEKMQLIWNREDIVSSDDEFAEMAGKVARFVQSPSSVHQRDAMELVAAVRSKELGTIAPLLDELYQSINDGNTQHTDSQLSKVIKQKRETKNNANATAGNKP